MKILVLGADGYLGWPTCMHLAARGHDVVAVDNYMKRNLETQWGNPLVETPRLAQRARIFEEVAGKTVEVRVGDVTDAAFLDSLFKGSPPDAVVHYAEQPSGPFSMASRANAMLTLQNNVGGTLNLAWSVMEHAPDCHIVKLGTMGEYGTPNTDIPEGWLEFEYKGRKDRRLFPREAGSLYHTTKILDTDLLHFYVRMAKLRVTDLMQGPVYGFSTPEIDLDRERLATRFHYDDVFGTLLNRFVVQAVLGHPLTVYGSGTQIRGYLDIRDTLRCVELALENPADAGELKVLNQYTEEFSVNELAAVVETEAKARGYEVEVQSLPNPRTEAEDHHYQATNEGFQRLGLEPHVLTPDTINGMLHYVEQHKDDIRAEYIKPRVTWPGR